MCVWNLGVKCEEGTGCPVGEICRCGNEENSENVQGEKVGGSSLRVRACGTVEEGRCDMQRQY